jgi:hypothetical protein
VPFTELAAQNALFEACRLAGITVESFALIRLGSNAVFRVNVDAIGRVAPDRALLANAEKQVAVARWLREVNYPAVRALDLPQPVIGDGRVVTFWNSVAPETVYAPIADVASLVRQLHALPPPSGLELPALCPFGQPGATLPTLLGLAESDRQFLHGRIEWARSSFLDLPFVLPRGVIHGDANVGNVLCDEDGGAVLIDLDSFSVGPREWDLVQTALFYDRLGWHSREEYRTFAEVYGYDLMAWEGYSELADMREIAMTTWLAGKAEESPGAAAEAAKRISAIRTGGSRRDWGPY